jgi:hypothetical protein
MTIHISGWSTSLTDLEICTLALCAIIIVCTIWRGVRGGGRGGRRDRELDQASDLRSLAWPE